MVDLVKVAEDFVKTKLLTINKYGKPEIKLTTSQIRKFLSAVNKIENKVVAEGDTLSEDVANEIKYLKISLAYQTGRIPSVKPLYNELIPRIDKIGTSKKEFNNFARYVEAIVAYHKFYGGQ